MTRSQTMAAALLGMWLGWTLFMFFVAGVSFSTAERILRNPNPPFSHATQALSTEGTRSLFRYFAAELNRRVFAAYGWGEIVLGTVLLWILNLQNPRDAVSLALAGALLSIAVTLGLIVTPQIAELGRTLDFIPRNPPPPGFAQFRSLHRSYAILETTKFVLGMALLGRWLLTR